MRLSRIRKVRSRSRWDQRSAVHGDEGTLREGSRMRKCRPCHQLRVMLSYAGDSGPSDVVTFRREDPGCILDLSAEAPHNVHLQLDPYPGRQLGTISPGELSRLLREASLRRVDCGSLVPTLIESELFDTREAHLPVRSRPKKRGPGCFQSANGGPSFSTKYGELPPRCRPSC